MKSASPDGDFEAILEYLKQTWGFDFIAILMIEEAVEKQIPISDTAFVH